ncbi:hypothetical protein [Marinobacterium lutimaris]|uniref:Uncharacterized protein n=1 Tax=Marinobacterium lutimaris TaxID=568106 RepID=A0A1H6D7A6_9GAMM|nr:hypothetical protein [Marinobacterium lutimaris]SEG80406.1 hypothetical protein SAMN05444390_10519 [Marinobacterium lutimaris]
MYTHRLLLLLSLIVALLAPGLLDLWLFSEGPWYQPFLIWAGLCILILLIEQWHRHEL